MSVAPLWTPSAERAAGSALAAFARTLVPSQMSEVLDSRALHRWSVEQPAAFWNSVWDFCGVIGEKGERLAIDLDRMPGAQFFPEARLNFAENLLRRNDATPALIFWGEDRAKMVLDWVQLNRIVSRLVQAMRAEGVGIGDRVAAMMPNRPETIAIMLAAASIGAVFSSCSPDFGEQGVLDRFGQIEPVLFFAVDGYWYAGKRIDNREKLAAIAARLPSVRKTVVVEYVGGGVEGGDTVAIPWDGFLAPFEAAPLHFERLPFSHPLVILYSSGTTGAPKCIVHGAGGTLLQHLKEHRLHADIRPGDRIFYFTTCGWMMWNWLVSGLASGATLLLYDGSPFHPGPTVLFDFIDQEHASFMGVSAKYLDALAKSGADPRRSHQLGALRAMASTGSPLSVDGFRFVYDSIKPDLHLASISGGTDIVSCFVLGDPTRPVYAGEIQGPGLGMAVDVWDDAGQPLAEGKGELVCTRPFPSMPIGFWNDPTGSKYRAAYFERFPGIWHHGDFAEWTSHQGIIIHGRSDATLNPGGVRIGTAEIYAQVEAVDEVLESLAIGQDMGTDVRIVLFVRLRPGTSLDDTLREKIRAQIRRGASPRHVPAKIIAISDIPRTKSGKIVELAVRDIVHGRPIRNREALANPEALDLFVDLPELRL